MTSEAIKDAVREKYAEEARRVRSGTSASCCEEPSVAGASLKTNTPCCGEPVSGTPSLKQSTPCCGVEAAPARTRCCGDDQVTRYADPITRNLYDAVTQAELPEKAVLASLGCGNPTALAELKLGEVVLDLGSGGGIDVLLSAKRVGPTGKAYGLDMTDEMLALARENQREAGASNVEFLNGDIEHIPLPDNHVDVIISNCVINLAADKDAVLREAFRVLKPGGRFAVSDVVTRGEMHEEIRKQVMLWVGCVAGALEIEDYAAKLRAAGFEEVDLEPTRIYRVEDAKAFLEENGLDVEAMRDEVDGRFLSAFIRGTKPLASPTGEYAQP
ncbi:MAG: arsenite methyltransferase [Bryobacterales bacterium]|nr:arsenite methyltransferase [Bryobacterales bacterium]